MRKKCNFNLMNKTHLREKYKRLRNMLAEEEIEEKSLQIANNLLKMPIWHHSYYHIFLPIEKHKEVNTGYILNILHGKDKEIVVPKSDFETTQMTSILLTDNTQIRHNSFGIPEPVNGLEVPPHHIDVIFVPLLALDQKGNRIGYGKGFYDRFLANCRKDVLKIGLSFFEAEESIKVSHEDVPLSHCVTPNKVYVF